MEHDNFEINALIAKANLASMESCLGNAEIRIQTRECDIKHILNEMKIAEIEMNVKESESAYQQKYEEEVHKLRRSKRHTIHTIRKKAEHDQKMFLDEIEIANERIERARNKINSSKMIIRKIPHYDVAELNMIEEYKRRIESTKASIERMKSKRETWEHTIFQVEQGEFASPKLSPRRKNPNNNSHFSHSLKDTMNLSPSLLKDYG